MTVCYNLNGRRQNLECHVFECVSEPSYPEQRESLSRQAEELIESLKQREMSFLSTHQQSLSRIEELEKQIDEDAILAMKVTMSFEKWRSREVVKEQRRKGREEAKEIAFPTG
eukprot:754973-Hanusia_phi.AAC.5